MKPPKNNLPSAPPKPPSREPSDPNGADSGAPMPGIRFVTIRVPIIDEFPRAADGIPRDGGLGYVQTRLGRGPAQGMHRVVLAIQRMRAREAAGMPAGAVASHKLAVSQADIAKFVFGLINDAATTSVPSPG